MQFAIGITKLTRDEKVSLLSQVNTLTAINLMNQEARKRGKKLKNGILSLTEKGSNSVLKIISGGLNRIENHMTSDHILPIKSSLLFIENKCEAASEGVPFLIDKITRATDWNTDVIPRMLELEFNRLSNLDDDELDIQLYRKMKDVSGIKDIECPDEAIAENIVGRAAANLNINTLSYANINALENEVFTEYVREIIKRIQSQMRNMTPEEQTKLEDILRQEILKLSQSDRDAMQRALKTNEISAQSIMNLLKTGSAAVLAQMVVGSFGFGAYLFLTTIIKAMGLLFGITISFGVYSAASAVLSFLLSAPFLLVVFSLLSGLSIRKTMIKLNDEIAKMLILVGKGKLISAIPGTVDSEGKAYHV